MITFYASACILNNVWGSTPYTPPATWYVGLSTQHVSSSGSNVLEPSAGAYARVAVTNNKSNFSVAASGSLTNLTDITFPESTSSWGTIQDVAIFDGSGPSANIWFYQALTSPRTVDVSTTMSFSASALTISMTNPS